MALTLVGSTFKGKTLEAIKEEMMGYLPAPCFLCKTPDAQVQVYLMFLLAGTILKLRASKGWPKTSLALGFVSQGLHFPCPVYAQG
jgi:hypothetical protein